MTSLAGRQMIGRYKIIEKIASGGHATIYKAFDHETGRIVALKVLDRGISEDSASRIGFLREAGLAKEIKHPNVIEIFEIGEADDEYFIAMEYVAGNLTDLLRGSSRMPVNRVIDISLQIASALEAASKSGVVHRDIKPSNVLIGEDASWKAKVKLADFGISHAVEDAPLAPLMGTPHFMSPEQGRGDPVDARSDIYSFGVVMYRMLTGKVPFSADSPWDVIRKHIHEIPAPLNSVRNDLPVELVNIVNRCMAKSPDGRYQSPEDLSVALELLKVDLTSDETQVGDHSDIGEEDGDTLDLGPPPAGDDFRQGHLFGSNHPGDRESGDTSDAEDKNLVIDAIWNPLTVVGLGIAAVASIIGIFQLVDLAGFVFIVMVVGGLFAAVLAYVGEYRTLLDARSRARTTQPANEPATSSGATVFTSETGPHGRDLTGVSPIQIQRETILTGLRDVGSLPGLRAFKELDFEHDQLQQLLIRKNVNSTMAMAQVPEVAQRTYEAGLGVLEHAVDLMRLINDNNSGLEQEMKRLSDEITELMGDDGEATRREILEESLSIHQGRIDMIRDQQNRVDRLLNQSRQCQVRLSHARAEVASIEFDKDLSNVVAVIDDLKEIVQEVREVEDEINKLGV